MIKLYQILGLMLFTFSAMAQAPVNDNFSNALPVVVNGELLLGNNDNATQDMTGVPSGSTPDIAWNGEALYHSVWYTFVGSGNPVTISTCSNSTEFDTDIAVMKLSSFGGAFFYLNPAQGAFTGMGSASCSFGGGSNNLAAIENFNTDNGSTYYVRIASHFQNSTGYFGLTVEDLVAAPVTLERFWATTWEKGNTINWETSSEENVLWHIIERSTNGFDDWQEVGKLVSETTARDGAFYELVDNEPFNTTYYRLRTVDYDHSEQLSDVVSVKRERPEFDITKIYPNPIMEGEVTIQIDSDRNEDINVRIVDVTGKNVELFEYAIRDGLNEIKIDMTGWRSGVYFAQFQSRQGYSTRKIFKQE